MKKDIPIHSSETVIDEEYASAKKIKSLQVKETIIVTLLLLVLSFLIMPDKESFWIMLIPYGYTLFMISAWLVNLTKEMIINKKIFKGSLIELIAPVLMLIINFILLAIGVEPFFSLIPGLVVGGLTMLSIAVFSLLFKKAKQDTMVVAMCVDMLQEIKPRYTTTTKLERAESVAYSNNHMVTLYRPVFAYTFNNQEYVVKSAYANDKVNYIVGKTYQIKINPKKPWETLS